VLELIQHSGMICTLQTEDLKEMLTDAGTQSDSLLLMENADLNLDQQTVSLMNLGMSLEQAHNIRTAVCNLL